MFLATLKSWSKYKRMVKEVGCYVMKRASLQISTFLDLWLLQNKLMAKQQWSFLVYEFMIGKWESERLILPVRPKHKSDHYKTQP